MPLSALGLETLGEHGEFTALAALAHHADMDAALGELASSAGESDALNWTVETSRAQAPAWSYTAAGSTKASGVPSAIGRESS